MNYQTQHSVGFNLEWEAQKKAKLGKIEELRKRYITLYTQRDSMLSNDRDDIYCRYINILGKTKYENFKLSVEVRALKLKVELAQAALNRNQRPDLDEIDLLTRSKLNSYFEELEEQSLAIKAAEDAESISRFTVSELKDLYHVLVRRLHPDLHPELPEHLKDLFFKGQAAYRSYDINLLRDIIKRLDMNETKFTIADESLDDTIARFTRDTDQLSKDIEGLRAQFPFNIEKNLLDSVWVNEQLNLLKDERKQLEEQKNMYTERLDLLTN